MDELIGIASVLIASLIAACGAFLFKKGSKNIYLTNKYLIFGVLLYITSVIFYVIGLKKGRLSVLYSFSSITYLWICLFSIKFLHEKMNLFKWMGVIAIILGVSLIGIG